MFITVLFTILFFIAGGYNFILGNHYDAFLDVVFSLILLCMFLFFRREKKKSSEFLQWIESNQEQICDRGLMNDNGYVIDKSTELVQYFACVSLLVLTIKVPSRFYIKRSLSSNIAMLIYTLSTVLLGWWGLPKGPIYTVFVIFKNITGGNKVIVSKLIEQDATIKRLQSDQNDNLDNTLESVNGE